MTKWLCMPLAASLVTLSLAPISRADTAQLVASRAAACAVNTVFGVVDLIPDGASGVVLRVTTPEPDKAARRLSQLWPAGLPSGVRGVVIDEPRPKLAVVLDDFGLHADQLSRIWALAEPLTYAILPGQKHSFKYAHWLRSRGASILAHIPMEPNDSSHMTLDGFLTANMTSRQRVGLLRRHIQALPGTVGWNNHMGSRLTSDLKAMQALVAATRKDEVILDSRTSVTTALESAARKAGHPTARRHVFIDNLRDEQTIFDQLIKAMEVAIINGHAVAIGHAYPETARAIRRFIAAHAGSIQLVPIERVSQPPVEPEWTRHCRPAINPKK